MKISSKYKVLSIVGLLFLFVYYTLYIIHYTLPRASAWEQCILESDASKAEVTGLASAPITGSIKVNVNVDGTARKICVENERAGFVSYKLPSYDDLKSLYFDQSKSSSGITKHDPLTGGDKTEFDIPLTTGKDHIYYITDNLTINGNISGGGAQIGVIFVDKNLSINQNITSTAGLVFVTGKDVNINQSVTQIDAVLISQGTIYTAGGSCTSSSVDVGASTNALTINGSLISLNSANPIKFCRKFTDNTLPAEKIHYEPKYLVILKDLFSDTYQKWSEIQ